MKKFTTFIFSFFYFFGLANAQFGPRNALIHTTDGASQVYTIDLDNDGDADVLSASEFDNKIAWYENLNGEFGNQKIISNNGNSLVYAADLDGDGDIDVLSSSQNNEIVWHKNLGGGVIDTNQIIISTYHQIYTIRAADFDNDGDVDVAAIVLLNPVRKLIWYENTGGGIFTSEILISDNLLGARKVFTEDLDNDGDVDLLSVTNGSSKISWYENLGGGIIDTFQQVITPDLLSPFDVYTADMDNDGDNDVLSASSVDNNISWYENLGGGIIDTIQNNISTSVINARIVHASDLDGDGNVDVLSGSDVNRNWVWFKNLGGGIMDTNERVVSMNIDGITSIYTEDVDNDGDNDVLLSSVYDDKIVWFENDGTGIFGREQHISTSIHDGRSIFSLDFDNDKDIDILTASESDGKIAWYENAGGGFFKPQKVINPQIVFNSQPGIMSIFPVDIDNDGDLDIISARIYDDIIAWHENLGGEIFDTVENLISSSANGVNFVFSIDLNGDGDKDVLTSLNNDDKVVWFENLGGGTIDTNQNVITSMTDAVQSVFAIDLDGDSDMDVLSASYLDDKIAWYENLGSGVFGSQQIISSNSPGAVTVLSADMDGDGDNDVISNSTLANQIEWYENLGSGVFGGQQIIATDVTGGSFISIADIDGDGDNDVLSSSPNELTVFWYENLGGVIDTIRNIINIGDYFYYGTTGDFDWDGDLDVVLMGQTKVVWNENFYNSPYLLKGKTFYDANQNSSLDSNEIGLAFIQTKIQTSGLLAYSDEFGNYMYAPDTGSYTISYTPFPRWNLTTDSTTFTRNLSGLQPIIDSLNFGFFPDTIMTEINPNLTGGLPRCDRVVNYWINYTNDGTTIPSGVIHLLLDDSIDYVASAIAPDSIIGQNIFWHYDSLFFFANGSINLQVLMPPFTSMGDTLSSFLTITELDSVGNIIYSNTDSLKQVSTCPYDPNDKKVLPKGMGQEGYVFNDIELEYIIRFQNTGNDTAVTVMIRDQLSPNLNWSSLQPISSSHPVQVWVEQDGEAVFKFNNIMLPDSNINEINSHGFVKFKIDMNVGLLPLTKIYNTSHIYFDNNPAVLTNTVLNTIYDCSLMNFSMNTGLDTLCKHDVLTSYYLDNHLFNNHNWSIDEFYSSTDSVLNWVADTTGVFSLYLTSSNELCTKDTNMSLVVNPMDVTLDAFSPDTLCDDGNSVALPIGLPLGGTYTGTGVGGGNFDPTVAGLGTHDVIYTFTDANSCVNNDTVNVTVQLCVGIENSENAFGILIYPNPNTGLFTIEKPSDLNNTVQVKLLDAVSKKILEKIIPIGKQKVEVDITKYSNGIYYLQLIVDEEIFIKQILKQ